MRQPRLKAPREHPFGYYHCFSRVVNRDFVLGEVEREHFVALMRQYERFCGVSVLTHNVMSNHFHILLEVPARPSIPLSDEELLERCAFIYSPKELKQIRGHLERRRNQPAEWHQYRERYVKRMWDLSQFMKSLKQRFTQWFNKSRPKRRKGTLWEERFGSVVVEGTPEALATVAAYIDLNPVRAGMVEDPKDYRWSGYGAASGGDTQAQAGLKRLMPGQEGYLACYRKQLYAEGVQEGVSTPETPVRKGFSPEVARQVWASGGELTLWEALRCRVRYFMQGAALGSRGFAEEIYRRSQGHMQGGRPWKGPWPLKGIDTSSLGGLFSMRKLRREP